MRGAEQAGELGVEGYDDRVVDLRPRRFEREMQAYEGVLEKLREQLAVATEPLLRQDLEILVATVERDLKSSRLWHDRMLPYIPVARIVFDGIHGLLDERVDPERRAHAVLRLQRYVGLAADSRPITELARARTEERFADQSLTGPFRGEVEQDLADAPSLLRGLESLFEEKGLDGYAPALAELQRQIADYDVWLKTRLLPRARADARLPGEIYADNLEGFGVDIAPQQLITEALIAFAEIRNEMRALAPLVAHENELESNDYREVIRALKKKQLVGNDIVRFYEKRLNEMERIIRREALASLPERDASIRLATEAETAITPAPHMSPPRLIGNTGQYGEFVLPLNVPGKGEGGELRTDDFTFDAAAWTLTAHEVRPGHEMQFAAMIEEGVSLARAIFAFNSVNVEGWALYAEAEMKPYFPLDGQLICLQHRLMRAARAFLDPMLNLGMIAVADARRLLVDDVVLSEAMARQEIDRYTFRAPGQATSYFYGYRRLLETRQSAELALGERFDRKAFHDFVLAQGLLPPALLKEAVMEGFVGARRPPQL